MRHALILALGVAVSILPGPDGFAASAKIADWPTHWQVNGNGVKGTLEFSVDDQGAVTGRLLDQPVEGFVSGRRLFLRRSAAGQAEVWEGWLAQPRRADDAKKTGDTGFIVAGSISVSDARQTQVYPWFGTTETVPETPTSVAPGIPIAPVAASRTSSDGTLSGIWSAEADARIEIDQQGSGLIVTLSDGTSHAGRMTGSSSFVVGLRKGCCSGTLETPDVIVWSDGVRWERAD